MSKADKRAAARLAAVQALYQMEVTGKGINEILAEFEAYWIGGEVEGDRYKPAEVAFFRDIVAGVLDDQLVLDRLVDDTLSKGWPLKRVEAVMRAILRAGAYELRQRADVPARVVIKEYVDVAGAFFDREEAGLVNAVLDALARQLRVDEFAERAN
ncbi:MAG: transcription antitermination factor NusB [Methylobacteriaceae bacterium]|nr:transcription antitermination factor NusB [Methylobacteriaceae bacterium]